MDGDGIIHFHTKEITFYVDLNQHKFYLKIELNMKWFYFIISHIIINEIMWKLLKFYEYLFQYLTDIFSIGNTNLKKINNIKILFRILSYKKYLQ